MKHMDKLKHAAVATLVAVVVIAIAVALHMRYPGAYGAAAALLVGLVKEAWDRHMVNLAVEEGEEPKHTSDPLDVAATAAGGVLVSVLFEVWQRWG